MKKTLTIIVTCLILSSLSGMSQTVPVNTGPEDLVPQSTLMYVRTSPINKFLTAMNYLFDVFALDKMKKDLLKDTKEFKAKTGIDVLDPKSLSDAGIDINRPACLAYLSGKSDNERILIFLPVQDEKKFPLQFVKVLKKAGKDKSKKDFNPVITPYKKFPVYQVLKDVFFTTLKGYFVVSPSGDLIRKVIDMHTSETNISLNTDPIYSDYIANTSNNNDLDVFIKKQFLDEVKKKKKAEKTPVPMDKKGPSNEDNKPGMQPKKGIIGKNPLSNIKPDKLKFLDYFGLGFRKKGNGLSFQLSGNFKPDSQPAMFVSNVFKTGIPAELLKVDNPLTYYFLNMDLKSLDQFCLKAGENSKKFCEGYAKFKNSMKKETGIDAERDFIQYFGGYINASMRKSKIPKTMDNFIIFIPMSDSAKSKALWKKLRVVFKKKHAQTQNFGEEKIDNIPSFWFRDNKGNKLSFVSFNKGIYVGNNVEFLRSTQKAKGTTLPADVIEGLDNVHGNVFFVSYTKFDKDSYLSKMINMMTARSGPQIKAVLENIDQVHFIGRRKNMLVSLEMTIKMLTIGK